MAIAQQAAQHLIDSALLPETLKDERGTDDASAGCDGFAVGMGAQDGVLFREAAEGMQQCIELAGGEQLIQPTQPVKNALLDLAVDALVLDDEQVSAIAVGLSADEQGAS